MCQLIGGMLIFLGLGLQAAGKAINRLGEFIEQAGNRIGDE